MTLLAAVALTSLKELARRRVALLFVVALPLVFYVTRLETPWQGIRMVAIGVGWAVATLALFSHVGSRHLDQRLAVIGASPTILFFGRQIALVAVGTILATVYFALVASTQTVPRLSALALLLMTTVLLSAPLGALFSFVLPRELEGSLALLTIMAMQLLMDPGDSASRLLPLWSTREFATYAIESVGTETFTRGMTHFGITLVASVLIAWIAAHIRLKPVRLQAPMERGLPETRTS